MNVMKVNGSRNGTAKSRESLLEKRTELLSNLRTEIESLAVSGSAAPEDLAPVFHDQFVALQLNQIDFTQLKLVNEALARLDGGQYGVCVECGDLIATIRLKAIPWANRCIACQECVGSVSEPVHRGVRVAA
jgi:DnaK suppressor protein